MDGFKRIEKIALEITFAAFGGSPA